MIRRWGKNSIQSFRNTTRQTMYCTYGVTLRRVCAANVVVEKPMSVTHSECVYVAFGIQHAPHFHPCTVHLYNIVLRHLLTLSVLNLFLNFSTPCT
jgi:hypothetical protein